MLMSEVVGAGFILGFAGSLHCVGMCGPIIIANPYQSESWLKRFGSTLIYFIGKASTYAILGLIVGLIGVSVIPKAWQQTISIATGIFMLMMIWVPRLVKSSSSPSFIHSFVIKKMSHWIKSTSIFSQLILGSLNGLLPCGLVYMALAASLTTSDTMSSSVFMFVFGLGTMPLLFGLGVSKQAISFSFRHKLAAFVPVITTLLALLFILRGLSLGIPFLSPDLNQMGNKTTQVDQAVCH